MARQNMTASRIKPGTAELLTLRVLRRERISAHFSRVTIGQEDVAGFTPMGFDQWFRLFIPVAEDSLSRLPRTLNALSYAKYLTIAKTTRPVLRNYTVRAHRPDGPDGPELDVDFVLHGDEGGGPAATWARSCTRGDAVAILDEGIGFNPAPGRDRFLLVADESGLPAIAGVLASLPDTATGHALIEIPEDDDRQPLVAPPGVEVGWLPRARGAVPGRTALAAAQDLPAPNTPVHAWVVGEAGLAVSLRRHWVRAGIPKNDIMFCGYWKAR
ncbi:siderophore-interacting protein [Amycolatopsis sp. NPDC048633]|uniref:siderophore-interacting protein n=1 Tax=Amycolatopsis sp. NPDC048633 TaxID=3157095 RepID=UPI0033CC85EF